MHFGSAIYRLLCEQYNAAASLKEYRQISRENEFAHAFWVNSGKSK